MVGDWNTLVTTRPQSYPGIQDMMILIESSVGVMLFSDVVCNNSAQLYFQVKVKVTHCMVSKKHDTKKSRTTRMDFKIADWSPKLNSTSDTLLIPPQQNMIDPLKIGRGALHNTMGPGPSYISAGRNMLRAIGVSDISEEVGRTKPTYLYLTRNTGYFDPIVPI